MRDRWTRTSMTVALLGLFLMTFSAARAQSGPVYKVDPFWPKPLPNKWSMQQVVDMGAVQTAADPGAQPHPAVEPSITWRSQKTRNRSSFSLQTAQTTWCGFLIARTASRPVRSAAMAVTQVNFIG